MPDYSLYFHIPFCSHRCAYCDFNTYAGQEKSIPAYVQALCREIQSVASAAPTRLQVGTIFFGGGTPSLLDSAQYSQIFNTLHQHIDLLPDAEISLEANPGTISAASLIKLREIGFNRISFGVQSANPNELRLLERIHSYSDVINAVRWSRRAGFDNLNLDLIYGLPEQTQAHWQNTVKLCVDLHPEHFSAYALTLEHGTPFGRWAAKGLLPLPDPDLAAEMYLWADETLARHGYIQYEISNWAQHNGPALIEGQTPSRACRHNLQYWRNQNYLGFGAGAHGYADSVRYSNLLRIKTYIERFETADLSPNTFPLSPACVNAHKNRPREDMDETMLTGLRLTREGISADDFRQRFNIGPGEIYTAQINQLTRLGLLEWFGNRLRLTERGRLLGNQVFMHFVGE